MGHLVWRGPGTGGSDKTQWRFHSNCPDLVVSILSEKMVCGAALSSDGCYVRADIFPDLDLVFFKYLPNSSKRNATSPTL